MSDGILSGLAVRHALHTGLTVRPARYVPVDAVREALRSNEAVETYATAAEEHLVVTNGLKPGTFFEDRLRCVVCGPVDDHEHTVRMGLAALAGDDDD